MKKLIFILFCLMAIGGYSQQAMTAIIDANKDLIVKTESGCKAEFTLKADSLQIKRAHAEAVKYTSYTTLTSISYSGENVAENIHYCTLEFTHLVPVDYVHKMLLTFGVEKFEYDGKTYPLGELMNIVKK